MRWRRATEEQLEDGIAVKKLDKQEGFWYQQPDIWSKYLRRPVELQEICCAQFARIYRGFNPKDGKTDEDGEDDLHEVIEEENLGDEDGDDYKFHFIMTFRDNGKKGRPLPSLIKLHNPYPGEAG